MRTSLVLAALLTVGAAAWAEDPPQPTPPPAEPAPPPLTVPQAAEAVLAALKLPDAAALKALATQDDPDPWLVADELIGRGEHNAAEAFARAAPRIDTEALPAYVVSRRGVPEDPARRARPEAANVALAAEQPDQALNALGTPESLEVPDVVGVRLAMGRGLALDGLARLEESAAAFLAAAEAAERLGWLARATHAYYLAGASAYDGSELGAALKSWERQLALCERRTDSAWAALALANIGNVHRAQGRPAQAFTTYERALAAQEALGDTAGAATTLASIGDVFYNESDFARALPAYERALAAQEALGDKVGAATTLISIGNVHHARGDLAQALLAYERALAAQEALGDEAGTATTLGSIGNAHYAQGDFAQALPAYERALAAQEALGDNARAATTQIFIGNVHYAQGNIAQALTTFERALAAQEALGDKAEAARALRSLGNVHCQLGDCAQALLAYERALAAQEALGDRAGAAATLGSIGFTHIALGDNAQALATLERALAVQEALGDRAEAAATLRNIGTAHRRLGDGALALSTLERALAMQEALGTRGEAAHTLGSIGLAHYTLRDYAKALPIFERTLATMEAIGDKAGVALTLGCIGLSQYASGNFPKALEYERLAVVSVAGLARGLGTAEGVGAREPHAYIYDTGASAAIAENNALELAYFLESGRAGALVEGLKAREALWATAIPTELRAAELEARAREEAATRALRAANDATDLTAIRARRVELDTAREQVSAAVARIQREAKAGATLVYPAAATLDEIRATLLQGDVLVLYGMLATDACALVVTTAEARIVVLGETSKIEAAVQALALDDSQADPTAALAALKALVVTPLGLPATTRRLLVSPSGVLGYVPFAPLVPEATVAYVPSGTTYRLLLEEQGLRGEGVLALGDPDYQTKVDEQALAIHRGGAKQLLPLPGTREEAKAVGTLTLLGPDATKAGLRSALEQRPRWRAVHLACHGFVDTARPALSSLALTASGDEDGFLTALDVFRMKIPADLVVLSACETGKGKVVKTEGIVGLTRAFMFAGSPRIICSLWKVPDEATRALMTKFYELWNPSPALSESSTSKVAGNPGLPTAEALRQAQAYVRSQEQWKHPYYWAAWVLWGLPD